jgi:hypothetical protein
VAVTWADLRDVLEVALTDGFAIMHCHLIAEGAANRYVQFAFGPSEVYAEAVSNTFLDPVERIDAQAERALRSLGWLPPVRSIQNERGRRLYPNWYRHWTASPPPLDQIAEMAVNTLRDAYEIAPRHVRITLHDCDWCRSDAQAEAC